MGLMTWFKRLFGVSKDKKIVCVQCQKIFLFEEGEQAFFAQRGLTEPRRCPGCRKDGRRPHGRRRK